MPPHLVSVMLYCHRCKTPTTVLRPQDSIEWSISQKVDGDSVEGKLVMVARCPTCQKDIEISLKEWKQKKMT